MLNFLEIWVGFTNHYEKLIKILSISNISQLMMKFDQHCSLFSNKSKDQINIIYPLKKDSAISGAFS